MIQSIERGAEEIRKAALSTSTRHPEDVTRDQRWRPLRRDHVYLFGSPYTYCTITLRGRSASPPNESLETAHICTSITHYNSNVRFPCILLIGGYQISPEDHPVVSPTGCQERVIASVSKVESPFADLLFGFKRFSCHQPTPRAETQTFPDVGPGYGGYSLQ